MAAPEGPDPATARAAEAAVEATTDGRHQRWVAGATAAAIIGFSLSSALLLILIDRDFYGPLDQGVALLRGYAQQTVSGLVPYRDFAMEYPPLVLVPILLPVLLAGSSADLASYTRMFEVVVAGFGMLTMILIMRSVAALDRGRRDVLAAAAMVALSPLLLGPLMLSRYDVWPALLAAAMTWLLATGRPRWAAVALGLGVLAKVYPVVFAPFALVYLWRTHGPREAVWFAGITAAVVGLGVAPFLLLAPDGIIDALTRAFRRPIQVESFAAVLLYVREVLTGQRVRVVHTFDSYNLRGRDAELMGSAQTIVLGMVLLGILWLFLRGRPSIDRLVLAFAAALTAYVAFGRVFSPQYLIWLIAPLAVVASRRWSLIQITLAVAILLTGLYYPQFYPHYFADRDVEWIAVVLGRNLVLMALVAYLAVMLRRREPEPAAVTG